MLMIIKYLFLCPLLPPLFLNYQNNQHENIDGFSLTNVGNPQLVLFAQLAMGFQ